jgi:pre-mRNA-processing factor SLU7
MRRLATDLDDLPHASSPEKISMEETWREERASEEHVPNATEDDQKPKRNAETVSTAAEKRKRTLKQMQDGVTEEEMDEYRRKRLNAADPMTAYLGTDELVK